MLFRSLFIADTNNNRIREVPQVALGQIYQAEDAATVGCNVQSAGFADGLSCTACTGGQSLKQPAERSGGCSSSAITQPRSFWRCVFGCETL